MTLTRSDYAKARKSLDVRFLKLVEGALDKPVCGLPDYMLTESTAKAFDWMADWMEHGGGRRDYLDANAMRTVARNARRYG